MHLMIIAPCHCCHECHRCGVSLFAEISLYTRYCWGFSMQWSKASMHMIVPQAFCHFKSRKMWKYNLNNLSRCHLKQNLLFIRGKTLRTASKSCQKRTSKCVCSGCFCAVGWCGSDLVSNLCCTNQRRILEKVGSVKSESWVHLAKERLSHTLEEKNTNILERCNTMPAAAAERTNYFHACFTPWEYLHLNEHAMPQVHNQST